MFLLPLLVKKRIDYIKTENEILRKLKKINTLSQLTKEEQWMSKVNLFNEEEKAKLYLNKHKHPDSFLILKQYLNAHQTYWLNKMMYADIKTFIADDTLPIFDRMSMMNSLEVRVPLLDHKLVEFAAQIKPEFKLKNQNTKFILKETMKSILPKEIISKPKTGFDVPITHWIKEELAPEIEETINEIKKQKFFDSSYIEKLYKQHLEKKRDNSRRIWALLCFNRWAKLYNPNLS